MLDAFPEGKQYGPDDDSYKREHGSRAHFVGELLALPDPPDSFDHFIRVNTVSLGYNFNEVVYLKSYTVLLFFGEMDSLMFVHLIALSGRVRSFVVPC